MLLCSHKTKAQQKMARKSHSRRDLSIHRIKVAYKFSSVKEHYRVNKFYQNVLVLNLLTKKKANAYNEASTTYFQHIWSENELIFVIW